MEMYIRNEIVKIEQFKYKSYYIKKISQKTLINEFFGMGSTR